MFFGFIAITLTETLWVYMVLYYILNLGLSLAIPVFNSLISQHADKDKLGELMGISESIQSLSNAVFPVIAAAIFGMINYNIYIGLSILPLLGGFITFRMIKKMEGNGNK